jgi:hypothetical protein
MDDPMLKEFAALIVVSQIVTRPPLDRLASSPVANQLEDRPTMVVTHVCTCGRQMPS